MSRDYFAEMYVAGVLARSGWNVYFPRRDQGFDFIVTKPVGTLMLIRPVQVKGKYPTSGKLDRIAYGFSGQLSQLHPQMVLAIPFFAVAGEAPPLFTAYMPFTQLRRLQDVEDGFRSFPAGFEAGVPRRRRDYAKFYDDIGIEAIASPSWGTQLDPLDLASGVADAEGDTATPS